MTDDEVRIMELEELIWCAIRELDACQSAETLSQTDSAEGRAIVNAGMVKLRVISFREEKLSEARKEAELKPLQS